MSDIVKRIYCDHLDRADKDRHLIDVWVADADARGWTSMFHEIFGDAAEFHRIKLVTAAEVGWNLDAHLDRDGNNRHRGGPTRTKRGWVFECGTCGRAPRVLHRRVI